MRKEVIALLLYVVLTMIMTYPVSVNLYGSIPGDLGDPLLNTWILAWDVHKIMDHNLTGLFDANIFFPYKHTLAYSEHMIGSAIFALPVIAIFKNPVLAYNIIFLMGFFLSGFGMYLLAVYLTGNRLAAFAAGIIFAFFPWRCGEHLSHVQVQIAQWIPLTFLYLHKFIDNGKFKHLFLFTAFFVLQFLSNGYYAMFLFIFVCLFIAIEIYKRGLSDRAFFYKLGLSFLFSAVIIFPFFYPYVKLKHEMGFHRSMEENLVYSADILSYLSASSLNRFWGGITKIFSKPEGELFLGLTVMFLSVIGIMSMGTKTIRNNSAEVAYTKTKFPKILSWITGLLLVIALCTVFIVWITGGFSLTFAGIKIKMTHIHGPLTFALVLSFLRLLMEHRFRTFLRSICSRESLTRQRMYLFILILAILFSFGPVIHFHRKELIYGPYFLLFKLFPGFDGLRVPARFVIMTALAVSIFAAFGVVRILERFKGRWRKIIITTVITIMILFESASIPIPTPSIAIGNGIPEVYKWLASESGDFAILELPMPKRAEDVWKEALYVYYSTYHWKKLVNGYSGYFPPTYNFLYQEGMKGFPTDTSIGLLKELNIRYLIIHSGDYIQEEWEAIRKGLQDYEPVLKFFKQFDEAYVYEVVGDYIDDNILAWNLKEIQPDKWSVLASAGEPKFAIDRNLKTRWTTGRSQRQSDFFEINMGEFRNVSSILLELGPDFLDYPRGYTVEFSRDGIVWNTVKQERSAIPPLRSFIKHPNAGDFAISFLPTFGCFVRITQTAKGSEKYWSIREVHLFE